MTKSQRLKALLAKGYFPEELPPPFVTDSFAKYRQSIVNAWGPLNQIPNTKQEIYSYPRLKHLRRNLSIINPLSQLFVSTLIAENWEQIKKHLKKSKYAIEHPEILQDRNRAVPKPDFHLIDFRRLRISASFHHVLVSDISRFYGTLYTHAIPWALHGKHWCKKNLHKLVFNKSLGNQIDIAVRRGQENQTLGIPVGPDTSRIISEIVAVGIDEFVQQHLKLDSNKAFRNVDDWYIGFDGAGEAEDAISHIASACSEYELELNAEKTRTLTASDSIESSWPTELRAHRFPQRSRLQGQALEHYFTKAFTFAQEFLNQNVLDYAVKRTKTVHITEGNWPLYETYLLKAARANATVIPSCVDILVSYNSSGFSLDKIRIKKFIDDIIGRHASVGHHGEVSWALFLAKGLRIDISKESAKLVSNLGSSVCALLALDLSQRGLVPSGLVTSRWKQSLNSDGLHSDMWLLAYEANIKGWLFGATRDYVEKHPNFQFLKSKKIHFYDEHRNVIHIRKQKPKRAPTTVASYFSIF